MVSLGVFNITVSSYLSHFSLYRSYFLHEPIFPQNVNTLFYYFCVKNDSILSFWVVNVQGWWMWRGDGCGGRVDVEKSSVRGCSISQYDHISAIFHCIALIFCMHQYFLKI